MTEENQQDATKLSEQEIAIVREFSNARLLKELVQHPGWKIYLDLRDTRLVQLREQFMRAKKVDKDTLWAIQCRLDGILDFAELWHEGIMNAIECLNPEVMQQILTNAQPNLADMDGDFIL